jgi:hypothetical protein
MKTLRVRVTNKNAVYEKRGGDIVCGNSDYQIEFTFDSAWDDHAVKTARFIWNGKYQDVVLTGNTCTVPIITNATSLDVGVYAGDLSTTTPATIPCKKSILCGGGLPEEPPKSVYTQILAELDELKATLGEIMEAEY